MKPIGAILAGGRARRFGSDKARAQLAGHTLIDHVAMQLARHCSSVILCGRAEGDWVPDRPDEGRGPLAGLNAALHEGSRRGAATVLIAPCDTPLLPDALLALLAGLPEAAYVAQLPVLGIWPTRWAPLCDQHLAEDETASMRGWGDRIGACAIDWPVPIPNINSPDDLADVSGFFP